ncbi:MAG: hypothetical protein KKD01_12700 [Proteobacteria bacterium]|nr:hypothetical protein [Pseudomonadota bacterium]
MLMPETMRNTAATLVGFGDIKKARSIDGWEEFLHDGDAFLQTGIAAYTKGKKAFTPEILYNVIAMAIEKFVMAALMQRGALPYNHTMGDLVDSMDEVFPEGMSDIKDGLLDLDRYQEICDVDTFNITPPAMAAIPAMLVLAEKMQELVYKTTGEKQG